MLLLKDETIGLGCSSVVDHLPSLCEAQGSIPSIACKNKTKYETIKYGPCLCMVYSLVKGTTWLMSDNSTISENRMKCQVVDYDDR